MTSIHNAHITQTNLVEQTDKGEGECCSSEVFIEEICVEGGGGGGFFPRRKGESDLTSWGRSFQL